jgi:hypothetical protein
MPKAEGGGNGDTLVVVVDPLPLVSYRFASALRLAVRFLVHFTFVFILDSNLWSGASGRCRSLWRVGRLAGRARLGLGHWGSEEVSHGRWIGVSASCRTRRKENPRKR